MRPALPEPAAEDRRRAAAAALYMSITTTDDAQEQAVLGEEGVGGLDPYDDPYDEDAYYGYDEVVYGYDDANPYTDAEGGAGAEGEGAALTEGDLALQHLRSMLPAPGEREVSSPVAAADPPTQASIIEPRASTLNPQAPAHHLTSHHIPRTNTHRARH